MSPVLFRSQFPGLQNVGWSLKDHALFAEGDGVTCVWSGTAQRAMCISPWGTGGKARPQSTLEIFNMNPLQKNWARHRIPEMRVVSCLATGEEAQNPEVT